MSINDLKDLLLFSMAINYTVLIVWFGAFALGHDAVYRLHARWFKLSVETFDSIHYAAMAMYKLIVFILNVSPWLALHLLKAA